jgi:hypothetical protein
MRPTKNVHRLRDGEGHFTRSEGRSKGCRRLVSLFCILLTVFPAVGQFTSKYQVGTITEVNVHQTAGSGASDTASYDVSVWVVNTIYVVLCTPPLGAETVKYAAGRDLPVLVGKQNYLQRHIGSIVRGAHRKPKTCRETRALQVGFECGGVVA